MDFPEWIEQGRTPYERLVRYYANGRKVCNCGQAYRALDGGCRYGCSANQISAYNEIAGHIENQFFGGRVKP